MGSPISPVLSCLYMEYFGSELLPTVINNLEITWYRYIDDTFTFLPKVSLYSINNLCDSIKFIKSNGALPFLMYKLSEIVAIV